MQTTRKIILFSLMIAMVLSFSDCTKKNKVKHHDKTKVVQTTQILREVDSSCRALMLNQQTVMGVLYQQRSGEMKALAYQAFNIAKVMLDKDLADKSVNQHRTIVVDIDETVLDNSPYQAKCALENVKYPDFWSEWCKVARAKAIPGAVDFLNYAKANGVDVYYVTNRSNDVKEVTLKNLNDAGFPYADEKHLMVSTGESTKEPRRQQILEHNHISLLIGDNLNDFAQVFEKKSSGERMELVDKMQDEFGRRFIVLPNAMYGDWEGAVYNYNYAQPDSVKIDLRLKGLKGF
jgi:5''-nucleotidase, lipoprotein e(P4) family